MNATAGLAARVGRRFELAWAPAMGLLLAATVAGVLVLAQMVPPAVVPASAPATVFSAARALDHLRVIARAPHPTGSPESTVVRQYLVDQLTALNLAPEVQSAVSVYHDTGKWGVAGPRGLETEPDTWSLAGARVHNVMARLPGAASTGAVVLMAHYDSVPHGPGASDDGAGTAAILETARALLAGPALRNDVILLFTDGEEIGLMGSQAFAQHPWMQSVEVVLNLEARGSSGAVVMYETSRDNAWLIEQYAQGAVAPVTGSLATDVWRRMPNSSDLTVFLQSGKQGFNFAYTENWTDYHTTHDSLEDLDERSLQHHGANALALARHFGDLDLRQRAGGDAIFFSVLGRGVVRYPQGWAWPLTLGAGAAYLLVVGLGLRRGRLSARGLANGGLAFGVAAGAAGLIAFLAATGLAAAKGGALQVGMGGTYDIHRYEAGLLLIYLAAAGLVYAHFQRRARPADLAAGALAIWLLLLIATTALLPGGSYLFLWPLAAGVVALRGMLLAPSGLVGPIRALLLLPVLAGLVVAGGAVYLVQLMFGPLIWPAGAFLIVLLLALLFPYVEFATLPRPAAWAALLALLGAGLLAIGLFTPHSATQPRQNFLFYSLDADTGSAAWVARTTLPDATLAPWLGEAPGSGTLGDYFPGAWADAALVSPAPVLDQPAPELRVVEDVTAAGVRTLRLALRSPRQAWALLADVTAADAILASELYGERHTSPAPRDHVFFKVIGESPEGVEVTLELRPGVPVQVRLGDVSLSLPALAGEAASLLRTGYGGGHGIDSMTLVMRTYTIR
jgi:hypothetical protein